MVCAIADNSPLTLLQQSLELVPRCHSYRQHCMQALEPQQGGFALGIPGAAMGFCQALFNRVGKSKAHTTRVIALLEEIGAPWAHSHEMFWGYRADEGPSEFVAGGMAPLLGSGRVPILITSLDPSFDFETIASVLRTRPPVFEGETMLLRLILRDAESTHAAAKIIKSLLATARTDRKMPVWWPLLQAHMNVSEWLNLKRLLGADWAYVNIAVNPFTASSIFEEFADQITVAQVPIGLAEGMSLDGTVKLALGTRITGAPESGSYSLPGYIDQLACLGLTPTLIVLGPSLPHWTEQMNQHRIAALLPMLRAACDVLWQDLDENRRDFVWRMSA